MKILMTGATGTVGKELGKELVRRGHQLYVISRSQTKANLELPFPAQIIEGNIAREHIRDDRLQEVEAVVHLAGENIGESRWTDARKQRIYDSRILSLQNLLATLQNNSRLRVFVSTSAVGYYGDQADKELTENSERGSDFLAQLCQDWEQPLLVADRKRTWPQMRSVILRLGTVFSQMGGALEKLLTPLEFGVGSPLGTGKQYVSWIHIQDLVSLFCGALELEEMNGVYNAVAPNPLQNVDLTKALCQLFRPARPMGPRVPASVLRLALGEMATLALSSQRAIPARLQELGFDFQFPDAKSALENLFPHFAKGENLWLSEQYLPLPPAKLFPFFSDAHNLEKLTPESLKFHITRMSSEVLGEGTEIDYKLLIHRVPVSWRTRIESWQPPLQFVDTQLKGPYKKWHHTHSFAAMGPGTLMTDRVLYRLPLGRLGAGLGGAFVKKDLHSIFSFRRQAIADEFLTL